MSIDVKLPDVTVTATCENCGAQESYVTALKLGFSEGQYTLPIGWRKVVYDYSQEGCPYYSDRCPKCIDK